MALLFGLIVVLFGWSIAVAGFGIITGKYVYDSEKNKYVKNE